MTFPEFCSMHGVTKAEVYPLFDYWLMIRERTLRRLVLPNAVRVAKR